VAAFTFLYAFQLNTGFVAMLLGYTSDPLTNTTGSLHRDHHHRGLEDDALHGPADTRGPGARPDELHEAAKIDGASAVRGSSASRCR